MKCKDDKIEKREKRKRREKNTCTHTNTRLNLRSILNLTLALCPNQFDFKPYLCYSKLQKFKRFNFFSILRCKIEWSSQKLANDIVFILEGCLLCQIQASKVIQNTSIPMHRIFFLQKKIYNCSFSTLCAFFFLLLFIPFIRTIYFRSSTCKFFHYYVDGRVTNISTIVRYI